MNATTTVLCPACHHPAPGPAVSRVNARVSRYAYVCAVCKQGWDVTEWDGMREATGVNKGYSVGMETNKPPELLTIDEVATILRTTPKSIRSMREKRTGPPATKVGRRVLYPHAALLEWIDANTERGN